MDGVIGGTIFDGNVGESVVVVGVVVVGRVGSSTGTVLPVRRMFTTVFINGYRPNLQKLPEKSSKSGAHIIAPPRSFSII
jgi:hypothetical protein